MTTIHEPSVLRGSDEAEPPAFGPPPDGPYGPRGPQGNRGRGRRRILAFVAALVAVALAAALGVFFASSGSTHTLTSSAQTGASLTTSQIAAKVDPAVVDVTSTLGYQNGAAAGTGIVVTSSGEVLTNNHVVEGATSISVTDVGNGHTYAATVVGYDQTGDIAVLQLQGASGLTTATLGNSAAAAVGDNVVAIGNAGGQGGTPSAATGKVTALNQSITASDESAGSSENLTGLIQTNANIQAGDSGGPLVNSSGQVIAIDTAASSQFQFRGTPATSTEGFAIPISEAITIANQIEAGTSSSTVHIGSTAFLGVQLLNPGSAPGGGFGGAAATGVPVEGVETGSAAESAGITAGDTIVSIAGTPVDSPTAVASVMEQHHPGDTVSITWTGQSGQQQTATVTLATGPVS